MLLRVAGALALGCPAPDPADVARCTDCHRAQGEAWAGSRHAVSSTNPTFARSYADADHPWCLTCHAPTAEGVSCAACHVDAEGLRGTWPSPIARLAHPIRHDPALSDERLCAGCHQFDFPDTVALEAARATGHPPARFTDTPSQDTVGEWRRSAAAAEGRTCTSCHAPHRARGGHDRALLRDTIDVTARSDGRTARFVLTARGAAHAVPTGDPFRRLVLTVCPPERCDVPLATAVLARRLEREGTGWVERGDTRIPPATGGDDAHLELVLPLAGPVPPGTRWRLFHHLADPRHEPTLPPDEARSLVAEGQLVEGDREPL